MEGLEVISEQDAPAAAEYPAPNHAPDGEFTARLVSPTDFSLWSVVAEFAPGTSLTWGQHHGDEVVFVQTGALEHDGRVCPPSGAIIVEAGVAATVTAREPTRLVHMGPYDPSPPTEGILGLPAPGEQVKVVGPRGLYQIKGDGRDTHYYADSTCPTCRITLLYTARDFAYTTAPHSHSEDELIHILEGELRIGQRRIGPGSTLAIAADYRYGFKTPGSFAFINYRRDASLMTRERGEEPLVEGGLSNGLEPVMDLIEA